MKSRYIVAAVLALFALAAALFPEMAPLHGLTAHADVSTLGAGLAPFLVGDIERVEKTLLEIKSRVEEKTGKHDETLAELKARMLAVEQAGARKAPHAVYDGDKSPGQLVAESAEFKAIRPGDKSMAPVAVRSLKTAIVNTTGLNQPLVAGDRLPGVVASSRVLPLRAALLSTPTSSNMIEFARVNAEDIEASPQYSSPAFENVAKKESAISFELANEPVVTLAHWIPASRQVLSDSQMLAGFIDTRLRYGLALTEEDQILNGSGAGGNLNGLIQQATAYNGTTSGDQQIDVLLRACDQVRTGGNGAPDVVVIHPTTLTAILLVKDGEQRYLLESAAALAEKLGVVLVPSQAIPVGEFVTLASQTSCALFDREDATVRVAEQHSDFFVKNMVAVLAEERLALVVYLPQQIVHGSF